MGQHDPGPVCQPIMCGSIRTILLQHLSSFNYLHIPPLPFFPSPSFLFQSSFEATRFWNTIVFERHHHPRWTPLHLPVIPLHKQHTRRRTHAIDFNPPLLFIPKKREEGKKKNKNRPDSLCLVLLHIFEATKHTAARANQSTSVACSNRIFLISTVNNGHFNTNNDDIRDTPEYRNNRWLF